MLRHLWAGDRADFEGEHYRLRRPGGFLRPSVPPPIIVGGFGPRLAAIAGRHGDGFNTAAGPQLDELIGIARRARAAVGRDRDGFLVTVFAGLSERLLRAASRERVALARMGVDRLILLTQPPFDPGEIRSAGALLHTDG